MCLSGRFITNPYDGHKCFVTCGKCPACLQEKANKRMIRIKNESLESGLVALFCTLHYENKFVPYVKASDYKYFVDNYLTANLNIYRGNEIIYQHDYESFTHDYSGEFPFHKDFSSLKFLRVIGYHGKVSYLNDKVGVLYLLDIQLFIKRFVINCRRFGYNGKISYFYSGDYGENHHRPHFHFLVFVEKEFVPRAKLLLDKSWYYSDLLKFRKTNVGYRCCIELAKNPAAYVASYINSREIIPDLLSKVKPFKLFYHFSKGFGFNSEQFSLSSLLQKFYGQDLSYTYTTFREGVPSVSSARIPKHVLFRYWPKFKGYRLLSNDEVVQLVGNPQSIFFNTKLLNYLSYEEKCEIFKNLVSLKKRIPLEYQFDWLLVYPYIWSLFASQSIKHSYDEVNSLYDLFYHFVNIEEFYSDGIENSLLAQALHDYSPPIQVDPNYFPQNYAKHQTLLRSYNELFKHHRIKQLIYEI